VRPLRPQAPCALQRQDRPLQLLRCAYEPRCRALHFDQRLSIDAAISNEVLRVLKPLGIEAALKAIEAQSSTTSAAERQLELSLQQARYEAAYARRQYDAVDPANRLVAGELERRWNEALQAVAKLEGEIAALIARRPPALGEPDASNWWRLVLI